MASSIHIKNLLLKTPIVYAPLAGFSDYPYRQMSALYRPALMFCEMVKMEGEANMALEDREIDRLKEIFVTRQECQKTNEEIETKLSRDLVRLAVIENQLKVITWLLYAVAGGIITMLIKILFGG